MRPNRMLMMLGGCLLAGSAACADELGFVDCASHNDTTPVFAKARKSQDIVANVACGERFKVLVYGFVFSEIQTSDGKVGFIYSNVMTPDRSGGTLQSKASSAATPSLSAASEKAKVYAEPKDAAAPAPSQQAPAPVTSAAAAPAAASSKAAVNDSGVHGAMIDGPAPAAQPKTAIAPATLPGPNVVLQATSTGTTSADAPVSSQASSAAAPGASTPAPVVTAQPPAVEAAPAPAAASVAAGTPNAAAATTPAPASQTAVVNDSGVRGAVIDNPAATSDPNAASAAAPAQPQPATEAQPQPEAAPAPVEPVRPAKAHQRWERPNYGAKSASLLELFGGFAFGRMNNSGSYTTGLSMPGGIGAFAVNLRPWLQLAGDTSYNFQSSNGVKNIVYGNHYGPRIFMRGRTRWNLAPFGEVLLGGSRADTTVAATPGYPAYTVSANCFSIKVGGGVDVHPTKMFAIRLIDADYYRTSFGTNQTQTNYWISTGIVIKLMRGWWE